MISESKSGERHINDKSAVNGHSEVKCSVKAACPDMLKLYFSNELDSLFSGLKLLQLSYLEISSGI